jgi:hypothetical protein
VPFVESGFSFHLPSKYYFSGQIWSSCSSSFGSPVRRSGLSPCSFSFFARAFKLGCRLFSVSTGFHGQENALSFLSSAAQFLVQE